MLENQFIQFKETLPSDDCEFALPIVLGGEGISFFANGQSGTRVSNFKICNKNGDEISGLSENISVVDGYAGLFFGDAASGMHFNKTTMLARLCGEDCVRIKYALGQELKREVSQTFTEEYLEEHGDTGETGYECKIFINVGEQYANYRVEVDVNFKGSDNGGGCPIIKDEYGNTTEYVSYAPYGGTKGTLVGDVDESGMIVFEVVFTGFFTISDVIDSFGIFSLTPSHPDEDNVIIVTSTTFFYSNLLHIVEDSDGLALIKYVCDEDAFGFPFGSGGTKYLRQWVPIRIDDPQFKISDKTYEKLNGEKVVLYAAISKEYNLETEYIPEEWHDKLIAALCSDHVFIDGVSLNKSGEYSIEWDKYTTADCGKKIVRGTCKMTTNFNIRNSN